MTPRIVIPTYNRAGLIRRAVDAALAQSHPAQVLVVDDGSTDDTRDRLADLFGHPGFCYIRLGRNIGTARAKNIGIVLAGDDPVTFHDSDDVAYPDKLAIQMQALAQTAVAGPDLNWPIIGVQPGQDVQVQGALGAHRLILPDGRDLIADRGISLADDLLPHVQLGPDWPGEWTHINSGLYRAGVFVRHGGFADLIEEDRDFRNRLLMSGEILWVGRQVLFTKYETQGSLTLDPATGYDSPLRLAQRRRIWQQMAEWLRGAKVAPVPITLTDVPVDQITNPAALALSNARMDEATRAWARALLGQGAVPDAARDQIGRHIAGH